MILPAALDGFFFRRINARSFSLMRVAWAACTAAFLLMQCLDVVYYYSDAGIFPRALEWTFVRPDHRFTVLWWVGDPIAVYALYLILLVCLLCMAIGVWPRLMTIASVLLLYSFHERNTMILGGGDTLLRSLGLLLMITPGIDQFSLSRAQQQWEQWKRTRTFLPPTTMPIWPWRLLLWQMIVLYSTSLWYKLLGSMWWNGTAVEATFHHTIFTRWPPWMMNMFMPAVGMSDYLALIWQGAWLLLLIPRAFTNALPASFPRIALRRWLMIGGIFFHGGILLLMDAGVFSLAIFTAYLGLLRDEDSAWMKQLVERITHHTSRTPLSDTMHHTASPRVTVLYDGRCGLCLRSIFWLQMMDWLGRLRYVNFRDAAMRAAEAPDVTEETLDKAMHIRLPDGSYQTGYDAFRYLTRHLPALWPILPLLYLPGAAPIGRRVYAKIAANRQKCDHEGCAI